MIKLEIGKHLKYYRTLKGMTQDDVAQRLGVSSKTVSSWESDRTEPNIGIIEQLARIFECNKSDLIGMSNDVPKLATGTAELLDLFSRATPEQRKAVITLLRSFVVD